MVIVTICYYLLYTVFCILLFLLAVLIGLKVWLQPVKGKCRCKTKLDGKVVIVTGGNSGIGLETAKDIARRGATVVIASRDEKKSEAAVKHIIATTGNKQVHYRLLDLNKLSSVRDFAKDFKETFDRLDILVNNAGCAGLKPQLSKDGIDKVTQINYVGPFLLTNLLLDRLEASKPSRIVIVSSIANKFSDFKLDNLGGVWETNTFHTQNLVYANSKLCNILWAKALAKRLPSGVTANALHPGIVETEIFRRMSKSVQRWIKIIIRVFFKTPEEGAQTTIHLCVAPELEGVSGQYFSECNVEVAFAHKSTYDYEFVDKVWEKTLTLIK